MEGHTVSGRGDGPDRPCHLLELPSELRNEIYKLALYHPGGVTFDCVTQKLLTRQPLALSMTCKQIRNESESIVFAQNDLRLESFTPIIHENQLRAGHRFLYSLLVSSRLGSKFRGVHLVTESHDFSKPSKSGVRNHPMALRWFEMSMISLCRERKFPIRWSFDVTWHGLLVAYEVDMKDTNSTLASIDQSFEQANVPKEAKIRRFHADLKEVMQFI